MNASSSFIALAGLLALVGGCEPREAAPPSPIRPVLSVVAEEQGSDNQAFTGTVEPAVSADLSFQVLGQLISRKVGAGDLVAKGETLATIDPTALELAVRRPERVEWYSFQVAQTREVPTAPIKMHGSAQRR